MERSIVMSMFVRNYTCKFYQIFCTCCCGCGSVLFWQHCYTLCTSSFVDDVTFSYNGLDGSMTLPQQPQCMILSCYVSWQVPRLVFYAGGGAGGVWGAQLRFFCFTFDKTSTEFITNG